MKPVTGPRGGSAFIPRGPRLRGPWLQVSGTSCPTAEWLGLRAEFLHVEKLRLSVLERPASRPQPGTWNSHLARPALGTRVCEGGVTCHPPGLGSVMSVGGGVLAASPGLTVCPA